MIRGLLHLGSQPCAVLLMCQLLSAAEGGRLSSEMELTLDSPNCSDALSSGQDSATEDVDSQADLHHLPSSLGSGLDDGFLKPREDMLVSVEEIGVSSR